MLFEFLAAVGGIVFSVSAFIVLHKLGKINIGTGSSESLSFPEDKLKYYRKYDYIRDVDNKSNPDLAPVVYTFLFQTEENKVALYKGRLESEEERRENPHNVVERSIRHLLAYTNVRAEVRRKEAEGARIYCKKDNKYEKERRRQYEKEMALHDIEAGDNCDMVERVHAKHVSDEPQLPEGTDSDEPENDSFNEAPGFEDGQYGQEPTHSVEPDSFEEVLDYLNTNSRVSREMTRLNDEVIENAYDYYCDHPEEHEQDVYQFMTEAAKMAYTVRHLLDESVQNAARRLSNKQLLKLWRSNDSRKEFGKSVIETGTLSWPH